MAIKPVQKYYSKNYSTCLLIMKNNWIHTCITYCLLLLPIAAWSENYEQHLVILKIKPEYRQVPSLKTSTLYALLHSEVVVSVERKYPRHTSPEQKTTADGQLLSDLSLLYEVTLKADVSEDKFIKQLLMQEEIAYAERIRTYEPLAYMPNDPQAQANGGQAPVLSLIKAYQAWDVQKGDSNVVVGIIDTGTEWAIPDLWQSIKLNPNDPINDLDDDNNGYIDDYKGWDLADNDGDPTPVNPHGTSVAGLSSAKGENNIGTVGSGLRCKLWPIKVYSNIGNRPRNYEGVIYAADNGCHVINLSWGFPGSPSSYEQEIINYAALNKNVVVVAAGGNTPQELDFYPASYDNVLSVVHTDVYDQRNEYATFSYNIDMTAPGVNMTGITSNGVVTNVGGGSSFASPIVAGAAALVRSQHPTLNSRQIIEILRINSDNIDNVPANSFYAERMGTGRLNMEKAINKTYNTSLRVINELKFKTKRGNMAFAGDTAQMWATFFNYLAPVGNVVVQISSSSQYVSILQNTFTVSSLPSSSSITNNTIPFSIKLNSSIPENKAITFRFLIQGNGYTDYQYKTVVFNKSYADIDINKIATSVGHNGRIGHIDDALSLGKGLVFNGMNMLYEAGLMIGISEDKVSNCVRTPGLRANDFRASGSGLQATRFDMFNSEQQRVSAVFNDSLAGINAIGVRVKQTSYAVRQSPQDKNVVIEYNIHNLSGQTIDSLLVGIFADFDVQIGFQNKVSWDAALQVGYTYSSQANSPYVGIQLLSPDEASFYAIDNTVSVADNNIFISDGFSIQEKFLSMSRGLIRTQAGVSSTKGNDVVQVNSTKIKSFAPNSKRKVAFAFLAGNSLQDLKNNAMQARSLFRQKNKGAVPQISDIAVCSPFNVLLYPPNGSKFRFYNDATLTNITHEGRFYIIPFVGDSVTMYVTNIDSLFESSAKTIKIRLSKPKPKMNIQPAILNLAFHNMATFSDISSNADSRVWNFGGGFTETASTQTRTFTQTGVYPIRLAVKNAAGCTDTLTQNYLVISDVTDNPKKLNSTNLHIAPNPSNGQMEILLPTPYQKATITIYNLQGQQVWQTAINRDKANIDLLGLATGTYLMHVALGNTQLIERIVLQR